MSNSFRAISVILLSSANTLSRADLAFAHGAERGLVMLLPTEFYAFGAMLAVALSFIILRSAKVSSALAGLFKSHHHLFSRAKKEPIALSVIATMIVFGMIFIGFYGAADPLSNLLSLGIWTGWWVAFCLIQTIAGDLWKYLNPWSGLIGLIALATNGRLGQRRLIKLPSQIGFLPAIILFFGFAWFELVSIAPEDPRILARAVFAYWLVNFVAILLFGYDDWMQRGEVFSILFRWLGGFSPFLRDEKDGATSMQLAFPGATFVSAPSLPLSGIALILLILGTASFDGLAETFTWMSLWDVNPLEYSGRSEMQLANTLGIILTPIVLGAAYFVSLLVGCKLTQEKRILQFAGRIIYSIIPISIAFHAAHYLTLLLINGQYLIKALSDPFNRGWDLFGSADLHVTASMVQNIDSVWIIWTAQVTIITLGHVAGIVLAHMIAMDWFGSHQKAARSQIVLAALMVFYTVFGLWLLSTPTIG